MQMNNLRNLRDEAGLTQEEVCLVLKESGCVISRSAYSKYETGSREMPVKVLILLAQLFKTTTDNILEI